MDQHQVLFCPFCRESFEGERACPDHDLPLVRFDQLGPDPLAPAPTRGDRDDLPLLELGYGRGWVLAAAVCNGVALGLGPAWGGASLLELAARLPSLWTPGLVAFTLGFVFVRRRSPRALRGMRVLVPLLGVVSVVSLGVSFVRSQWLGVGPFSGPAFISVCGGAVCAAVAGLRLGAMR